MANDRDDAEALANQFQNTECTVTITKADGWQDSQRKPSLLSAARYAYENRLEASRIEITAHTRDGDEPIYSQAMREALMDLAAERY